MALKDRFAKLEAMRSDISRTDLARAVGVKPPSVSDWFNGETKSLKAVTATKVAAIYGVSPTWLATGTGHISDTPGPDAHERTPLPFAISALTSALSAIPATEREPVAKALYQLAMSPDSQEWRALALQALEGGSAPPGTESKAFFPAAPAAEKAR